MIQLLERLRPQHGPQPGVLGPRAAHLLEWPKITAQIAAFCVNARAATAVRSRVPFAEPMRIELEHALADELRPGAEANRYPPLIELSDALTLLEQPPPVRLEGPDLVHLAAVAEELDLLRDHFLSARDSFPLWGDAAVQMSVFSGLSGAIGRALDLDGRIVDGASPLLARLRRQAVEQERNVRSETHKALGEARGAGWTTADEVTLRGDRFCLPLRSGDVRRVPGIVHDRSATGATLFVEPAGVVRLANELAESRFEIAAEEARILFELNRAAEEAAPALREAAEVMLQVDAFRAQLLWSRLVRGRRPRLDPEGMLRLCGGRHPLLLEALGGGDPAAGRDLVVPLDLELPPEARVLVISGPNAGGKSVALKSVGVFCLLAQCGWDVPAREDTVLPLIGRLQVDLGDEQSIAQSLSSFSAHLGHLGRFLAEAVPGTLVLCDEIGTGTDPQEGTALAYAVLEQLAASGARVLASTHFGLLKAAVHDHPDMVNAAMDYDERDLRPLFTFRVGDPGTSHAFDIAARMGLPAPLLRKARSLAGRERVQVEKLLVDLDRRARELAEQQDSVRREAEAQAETAGDLKKRLRGLQRERREVLERARAEGEELLRQGRRSIENAVREIRDRGADRTVVHSARSNLEDLARRMKRRLGGENTALAPPPEVAVGDKVRIPHLGLVGTVVEVRGERLTALADGLRMTVGRESVRSLSDSGETVPPAGDPSPNGGGVSGGWAWQGEAPAAAHEIDLRGLTGEEAWERVDRLIDRAIPAGLETIHLIHGFGTGRLRDHLHRRLGADPRVASFREAGPGRGGGGATQVTLQA